MTAAWVLVAVVATVVALVLAGIAGAACWWGCAQRRTAQQAKAHGDGLAVANATLAADRDAVLAELQASLAWLTADIDANVGDDR